MEDKERIEVIFVQPMKPPEIRQISDELSAMQELVGGYIEEYMPFEDDVAIVCNEEGKINGMQLNRGIYGEDGQLMDIIAGPFFIAYAPIESEKFLSMPDELKAKYEEKFREPEQFFRTRDGIKAIKIGAADKEYER